MPYRFARRPRALALALVLALAPSVARAQTASDQKLLASYQLTMPMVRKLAQASEALIPIVRGPEFRRAAAAVAARGGAPESIAGIAAVYDRIPAARQAMARAGLTPRQFVTAQFAYAQAVLTVGMSEWAVKEGGKDNSAAVGVPKANLDLVRQNRAEVQRINERLEALSKALGAADDEEEDDEEEEPA